MCVSVIFFLFWFCFIRAVLQEISLYIELWSVLAGIFIGFAASGGTCYLTDYVPFGFIFNTGGFKNTSPNANFGVKA